MNRDRIDGFARKLEEFVSTLPPTAEVARGSTDRTERMIRALGSLPEDARRALEGLPQDARRAIEGLPASVQQAVAELPKAVADLPRALDELPKAWDELPKALEGLPTGIQHALVDLPIGRPAPRRGPDARIVVAGVAIAGLAIGFLIGRADRRRIRWLRDRAMSTIRALGRRARAALPASSDRDRAGANRRSEGDGAWPARASAARDSAEHARDQRLVHAIDVEADGPAPEAGVSEPLEGSQVASVESGTSPDRGTGS